MQRWILAAVAVALLGGLAAYAVRTTRPSGPAPAASSSAAAITSVTVPAPAGNALDAGAPDASPAPAIASAVPPLPDDAPKSIRFGVILFSYAGAERAPKSARPKEQALQLAQATLQVAEEDFSEAVKRGDPGSTDDAGRIPRGILEPVIEYALFTLKKGQVYGEPLDTPRGYWIARRVE